MYFIFRYGSRIFDTVLIVWFRRNPGTVRCRSAGARRACDPRVRGRPPKARVIRPRPPGHALLFKHTEVALRLNVTPGSARLFCSTRSLVASGASGRLRKL